MNQKHTSDLALCLHLFDWHGGQSSYTYALASNWYSAIRKEKEYEPSTDLVKRTAEELRRCEDPDAHALSSRISDRFLNR